jgi:hypothetical protein
LPYLNKPWMRIHKRVSVAVLAVLLMVMGVSLLSSNSAKAATPLEPNVWMDYENVTGYASEAVTTTIFNGRTDVRSKKNGGIVLSVAGVKLDLVKGDKVVSAYISYGTFGTPTYYYTKWNGHGTLSFYRNVIVDGATYPVPIESIVVGVDQPSLPAVPLKGGG